MGMLNAMMRQQQPGFQSTGPAYPHFTQRMAETGQLSLGASAQPQPGFRGMGAGTDSGNALNAAALQQMQADPLAGFRLAQMFQQTPPRKQRSHTLGGGL